MMREEPNWALLEDVEFMQQNGEHFDRIARRLGLAPITLEKRLQRERRLVAKSNANPDKVTDASQAP